AGHSGAAVSRRAGRAGSRLPGQLSPQLRAGVVRAQLRGALSAFGAFLGGEPTSTLSARSASGSVPPPGEREQEEKPRRDHRPAFGRAAAARVQLVALSVDVLRAAILSGRRLLRGPRVWRGRPAQ